MSMKEHILEALKELFDRWEERLAVLSEEQKIIPHLASGWSVRDELVHLWAWQQRSIARLEAARSGREPQFPAWPDMEDDTEAKTNQINAWIYDTYHDQPWETAYKNWREGYLRFLEAGAAISERDLLDGSRYSWLGGHSLAAVLLASYDHHQEHLEELAAKLEDR